SPIATWVCDRGSLQIAAANAAAIAALGHDDLIGRSLHALWIDPARAEAELERAVRDRAIARWTQRTSAGATIELEAAVTAHDAGAWLVQATYVDAITPGRPGRAVVTALLDHLTEGIAIHGLDGQVGYVSPAVQKILGLSPEKLVGTRGSQFTNPEDFAR